MSTESAIEDCIDTAAESVGSVWPLHSFVTANPLAGFEDRPFHEAVADAEELLGGDGYPSAEVFKRAYEAGKIDPDRLRSELSAHGYDDDIEASLDRLTDTKPTARAETTAATEQVDAVLAKWLAAFLDQGQAKWPMPNREDGFYEAFQTVARHDRDIPDSEALADLPDDPADTIRECVAEYPADHWAEIFECQLAALPGWTGLLKQRVADDDAWQSAYPMTLPGYLAVRLALVEQFDAPLSPTETPGNDTKSAEDEPPLSELWLTAWEATYRAELTDELADASESLAEDRTQERPDAQLVFCIDTRSEVIRRHIEATGDYETHGYAGFFGVPMRHTGYDSEVAVDACPPILDAQHQIDDRPADGADAREEYDRWQSLLTSAETTIRGLRANVATAFSFVESTGAGYGAALTARTLLPGRVHNLLDTADERTPNDHEFCEPTVDHDPEAGGDLPAGLTLDEKVEYAATAFELMGWAEFAPLVVFAGHASETANNPFESSLDCGACAGNPGGPNARVLASICNDDAVRARLRERGIEIPEDTIFVAGEHNTTTDEVDLYAANAPKSHEGNIGQLRADLATARANAAAERVGDGSDADSAVRETERRAADWAETRPEWGLAGNAGFVIGPRELTDGLNLDGRSFLHSYDWRADSEGEALEAIMAGPMVVTQWINTQYYFATVDNATFGSGSKITHNPVGNVGVYQGNGGDIMTGLPLQSLSSADDEPYHQPLRLSTVIHAPVERVTEVLADNEAVAELLDNDWLSLTVVDPTQDHSAFHYDEELAWSPVSDGPVPTPEEVAKPLAADD